MSRRTQILVVDSPPTALDAFSKVLRSEGYDVSEASTGEQGLQIARERRPDFAVVNSMLPDISGADLCRQMKGDVALADTFVVLVSDSDTANGAKLSGVDGEADDHIGKPSSAGESLAQIRTMIRLRDAAL